MTNPVLKSLVCSLILTCSTPLFAQASAPSQALTQQVSVAGQMTEEKFKQLMQDGFQSVIVNRPDQEVGNTVSVNALRNIAEKSHVSVIYQPVIGGKISQTDVVEFAKYYNELPKPILMICRSGSRSSALFHQAQAQGLLNE